MRSEKRPARRLILPALGAVLGSVVGVATIALASAGAMQTGASPQAVFDATHLPPLLTLPGEQVDLAYDVHCAPGGGEDVESGCEIHGTVFARRLGSNEAFADLPLRARSGEVGRQLAAVVPDPLASRPGGFEYYAVLEAPALGEQILLPPGGEQAPHVSRRLDNVADVALGRHAFGAGRRAGARLASAAWGDGATEVGLEQGRTVGPIGASAFDVDVSGAIVLLDQANRRILRWRNGAREPARVPISVNGTIADLAVGNDGSFFVLETTARPERNPLVRRFDDGGRELEAIELAERTPAQIRMSADGPAVLGRPSHQWMPVLVNGAPAARADQVRRGRGSRLLRSGGEVVVLRYANELRLALVRGPTVTRAWRLTSATSLGEVQLAEPLGGGLVVVMRVYDERGTEFAVLTLDRTGVVDRFALDSADWAETAPLSRFRLVGRSLYRLGSAPSGAFVDRFDLEVR